ncbi:MAG: DNA polymerase III subunit gamma/tau [Pirellula sp.]|nr:DNA polymerase III subunit gamma/tau [Pirellula sp.]
MPPTQPTQEIADGQNQSASGKYTVVARRYRPKTFAELVGQSTVSQALLNAIHTNRVGHAYLFTGARGVGKTSTARIFAKALNASAASDGAFDPHSDIALAIDSGEDMDVIEIDGASNRGIDEIRQLRANASVRPSRSPYKIYIIDEVHMLTTQAFNALLKTLEEPPGHVKFIFCTTDPEKMPITVLSRCQRFDFPPVQTDQILGRLKFICENEGTQADDAALALIARRAAGSMRDSQSLLEQLLSFGGNRIRVEDVHAMLGTADETRLASFATRLIERDAAGALLELDDAAEQGVDVGQLAEQLLGYLRDMMAISVGGSAELVRTANPNSVSQLKQWGQTWGTMSLLSALQILDETIVKMRHSVQSRILMEIALVQICNMQDLQALADLVKAFSAGHAAPPPRVVTNPPVAGSATSSVAAPLVSPAIIEAKKKDEFVEAVASPIPEPDPRPTTESSAFSSEQHSSESNSEKQNDAPIDSSESARTSDLAQSHECVAPIESGVQRPAIVNESLLEALRESAQGLGGLIVQCVAMITRLEPIGKGKWRACIAKDGGFAIDYFQTGENLRRLVTAAQSRTNVEMQLEFVLTNEIGAPLPAEEKAVAVEEFRPSVPQAQLIRGAMTHPLVKQFIDMFDGVVVRVDKPQVPRAHVATSESATIVPSDAIEEVLTG